MSNNANLLADLDGFYRASEKGSAQNQQAQAQVTQPQLQGSSYDPFGFGSVAHGSQGSPAVTGGNLVDEDDDWGGFETAEPAPPQLEVPNPFNVAPVSSPVPALADPFGDFTVVNPTPTPPATNHPTLPRPPRQEQAPVIRNRPARVSTMQLVTNSLLDLDASPQPSSGPPPRKPDVPLQKSPRKPPRKAARRDPNVLFDADDVEDEDEDEDEFGAFEGVDSWNSPATGNPPQPSKPTAQPASVDLLSMDDLLPTTEPARDLPSASPATPWPDFEDGGPAEAPKEEWPSFGDFRAGKHRKAARAAAAKAKTTEKTEEPDNWDWDAEEPPKAISQAPPPLSTKDDYDDKEPPPTNIPPPSILMTILPELLNLVNTSLLKPTAGHSPAARKKLFSSPSTIAFLRAYLLIATVAARILAGRKMRWNRDRFLAQGMAISASGAKGMKLAGVDKAEAGREDREAADVVAAWGEQVGRVRAAVAGANGTIAE
ncbi:hypothetical protein IMZ48_25575, partial [Candidatus Bathyarchaeota archaeon]|nr:hypothetical protein [Candidatus Bathyarchaeota archaeon]